MCQSAWNTTEMLISTPPLRVIFSNLRANFHGVLISVHFLKSQFFLISWGTYFQKFRRAFGATYFSNFPPRNRRRGFLNVEKFLPPSAAMCKVVGYLFWFIFWDLYFCYWVLIKAGVLIKLLDQDRTMKTLTIRCHSCTEIWFIRPLDWLELSARFCARLLRCIHDFIHVNVNCE